MDEPDANPKGGLFRENIEELFERAPAGYLATMPDGRIVQVNQTLADWIGQPKQSLLSGVRFQDLLTVPGRIYYETHFAPLMQMQAVYPGGGVRSAAPRARPAPGSGQCKPKSGWRALSDHSIRCDGSASV